MKIDKDDDRRRFFRITDAIGVSYEIVNEPEAEEESKEEIAQKVDIQALLNQQNEIINGVLLELSEEQPQVSKAISALNKKLDTLVDVFELEGLSSYQHFQRVDDASISACGIGFPIEEALEVGQKLNLTLYLKPSEEKVHALGDVVACTPINDNGHYLRVEFVEMIHTDRECLIQHIVQRQGALLKSLREQLDDSE